MTNNKLADALDELCDAVRVHDRCRDQYNLNAISEAKSAIFALAEHDAQPAPDECFCDRMYPDSNPNASCGDCPTRDYAPKPTPAPVQVDGAGAGELPRYGIRWNGPTQPISVPMGDGYWTPWHLAHAAIAALRQPVPDAALTFTTGHCKNNAQPGGCQLHNLQCGYPACDRRPIAEQQEAQP